MNSKLVKWFFFLFSAIMMLSVVPAQADPYLELIGPDSVQLGHTATYTVTTVGGTIRVTPGGGPTARTIRQPSVKKVF